MTVSIAHIDKVIHNMTYFTMSCKCLGAPLIYLSATNKITIK